MSKNTNTPADPQPPLPDGADETPIIERPSTPIRQKRMDAIVRFLGTPDAVSSYGHIVQASVIGESLGVFVVGVKTSKHHNLAIKMRSHLHPSERDIADYAAKAEPSLTGRMYGWHRIILDEARRRETKIMVGDRVAGETVAIVWKRLGWRELRSFKKDITPQLAAHISRMRALEQPFIGRVGHGGQGPPQETRNFYDGPKGNFFGPFASEEAFDEWAVNLRPDSKDQVKWRKTLAADRQKRGSPQSFILTHADLSWNNVMVVKDENSGKYLITGLIDWDRSGFLPGYAEHAVLSAISFHDKGWRKVLRAAVPNGGCSKERLAFTRLLQSVCNPMVMGKY